MSDNYYHENANFSSNAYPTTAESAEQKCTTEPTLTPGPSFPQSSEPECDGMAAARAKILAVVPPDALDAGSGNNGEAPILPGNDAAADKPALSLASEHAPAPVDDQTGPQHVASIESAAPGHDAPATKSNPFAGLAKGIDLTPQRIAAAAAGAKKTNQEMAKKSAALKQARRRKSEQRQHDAGQDGRSKHEYAQGNLVADVTDAQEALEGRAWQRNGQIVYIGRVAAADGKDVAIRQNIVRRDGAAIIYQHTEESLTGALAEVRSYISYDSKKDAWKNIDPPKAIVKGVFGRRGKWTLPPLEGIATCPLIRPDGTIMHANGYDRSSGMFGDFPAPIAAAAAAIGDPAMHDATRALEFLEQDALADFPFVEAVDRAVAVAALLTSVARPLLPTAPMFAFTSPTPGSGKSTLCDLPSIMATGHEAPVTYVTKDLPALEKAIQSSLLSGDRTLSLDNIDAPLNFPLLNSILSQERVNVRLYHTQTTMPVSTRILVTACGNNLRIAQDQVRRTLLCRLDANCEAPETRHFSRNIYAWAKDSRADLVAAALTILRAGALHNTTPPSPFAGYEDWSRLVRGAMLWLGSADPLDSQATLREDDPVRDERLAVFTAWHAVYGEKPVTVKDLLEERAQQTKEESALADALAALSRSGEISRQRLQVWLTSTSGAIAGGFKLVGRKQGRIHEWRICKIKK